MNEKDGKKLWIPKPGDTWNILNGEVQITPADIVEDVLPGSCSEFWKSYAKKGGKQQELHALMYGQPLYPDPIDDTKFVMFKPSVDYGAPNVGTTFNDLQYFKAMTEGTFAFSEVHGVYKTPRGIARKEDLPPEPDCPIGKMVWLHDAYDELASMFARVWSKAALVNMDARLSQLERKCLRKIV